MQSGTGRMEEGRVEEVMFVVCGSPVLVWEAGWEDVGWGEK